MPRAAPDPQGTERAPAISDSEIQAISDWLVERGLAQDRIEILLEGFCERLMAAGMPLWRVNLSARSLNPTFDSISHVWRRDKGISVEGHRFIEGERRRWEESPLKPLVDNLDLGTMRTRLDDEAAARYPVFAEFRAEGATDHLAKLVGFGVDGAVDGSSGVLTTWTTDRPSGFSDREIAALERLIPRLALAVKSAVDHALAVTLLDTYVGHQAGAHILSGEIRRGAVRVIPAVIMIADLRGFSALADRLDIARLAAILNDSFDAMVPPVTRRDGEVLKYLGDGFLAIFERHPGEEAHLCHGALQAAVEAIAAVDALAGGDGRDAMELDVALHLGDVFYGNVGTEDRLDFTVVGPAVNDASRIELMCKKLGRNLLVSESFAAAATHCAPHLEPLGRYAMPGVDGARELWGFVPAAEGVTEIETAQKTRT